MPTWKIADKLAFVDGMITVEINIDLTVYPERLRRAQYQLGTMVLESCRAHMPLNTGSLQQRSFYYSNDREVVFPGPYARYQYGGVAMVDSVTGKGPALIQDKNGAEVGYRFRKGATLVPTERRLKYTQPEAEAEWFMFAKNKHLPEWIAKCDEIIKGGS